MASVSLVMQFLTPAMIGRIAVVLGLDCNNTQTAISAAVLTMPRHGRNSLRRCKSMHHQRSK